MRKLGIIIAGMVIVLLGGIFAMNRGDGPSIQQNVQPTAQAAQAPQTLLTLSGNSSKSTESFTTSDNWTLEYSYDCSNTYNGKDNFVIDINNTDGSPNSDLLVNELNASGANTNHYYDAGKHYLQIDTSCSYTVTVKG